MAVHAAGPRAGRPKRTARPYPGQIILCVGRRAGPAGGAGLFPTVAMALAPLPTTFCELVSGHMSEVTRYARVASCSSNSATGSARSAAGRHFAWLDSSVLSRAATPLFIPDGRCTVARQDASIGLALVSLAA